MNKVWKRQLNHVLRMNDPAGFSLVEIIVAMAIFLIVSAGVTSMMMVGVRSTVGARLTTMGKEAAQQQMEAIRSRTFYVPYSGDPDVGTTGDVDILDRYFPNTYAEHVTDAWGWEAWYTQTSSDAYYTVVSPPNENSIVVTVQTRFIDYKGNTITPVSTYNSDVTGSDGPASDLIAVTVTASWLNRGEEESYSIDSQVSRADQATQGGSNDSGGESGCSFSSQSSIDVTGGTVTIYTGSVEPYSSMLTGELGDADGTASYDCVSSLTAYGTGGRMVVDGVGTVSGASASAIGPPSDTGSSGPMTVGPTSSWPKIYLSNSKGAASVDSSDVDGWLSMAASARTDIANIQLSQVDGSIGDVVSGYKRWDFVNPVIKVQNSGALAADVSIVQDNGVSTGTGQVYYNQIDILPLQAYTANTPSATQGLIFIRDFQASVVSEASEGNGSASNSVTYSATIGMFNSSKASTCSGDACYDFYSISSSNPIQTAINLSSSNYKLQNAMVTEWHSYTASEINTASYAAVDGSEAMVNIDALLKISTKYGKEVRQNNTGQNVVELIGQEGLQKLWLGTFDLSIMQNA